MSKKNIQITLASLAALTCAGQGGADELFTFTSLGSGEEIRSDILAYADSSNKQSKNQAKKANSNQRQKVQTKATQGGCGEGACGDKPEEKNILGDADAPDLEDDETPADTAKKKLQQKKNNKKQAIKKKLPAEDTCGEGNSE